MENINIFNESCFEYLSRLENSSVDLFLIDPPYEISRPTGFQSGGGVDRFAISMDFGEWDKEFSGLETVINEAYRVLRDGGTFICFYDLWKITELKNLMEGARFKQLRFIEWLKTNPVPINSKINYLTNAREIALSGVKKGKGIFNSVYDNGIYEYPIFHAKDRFHPTQKPVKLMSDLIMKHSNPGDLVVDCFSGSGTTALSSMITDRKFSGCELDKDYFEKSVERLSREYEKLKTVDMK